VKRWGYRKRRERRMEEEGEKGEVEVGKKRERGTGVRICDMWKFS